MVFVSIIGVVLLPLAGLVLAYRRRIWEWPAGWGFALWLAVNAVGNGIALVLARVFHSPTYYVGLVALPLQVLALAVALCGLTTDRRHCRRIWIGTGIYLVALLVTLLLGDVSHWSMTYAFRSPYALFVVIGCGYAYIDRTIHATVAFRHDGSRLALVGVLLAVVPVLVLELALWGLVQLGENGPGITVLNIRRFVLITGYLLVSLSFRQPWTFARSG